MSLRFPWSEHKKSRAAELSWMKRGRLDLEHGTRSVGKAGIA
jgi:hypothetical protein